MGSVCAIALAAHALRFWPFLADDALISLRYTERLLSGHGLTWTDGPHVEGYSNLSWILLNALGGLIGLDLIVSARFWGFLTSMIAVIAATWAVGRRGGAGAMAGAATTGLALALSPALAAWAIGGLETPLVAACLACAWAVLWPDSGSAVSARRQWLASIPLAVLVWTRPDGPLFVVAAATVMLFSEGPPSRSSTIAAFRVSALPFGFFLAQMAFRLAYYGDWVPNTARVKISPSDRHFEQGMAYIGQALLAMAPVVAIAVAATVASLVKRPLCMATGRGRLLLVMVPAFAWMWYVCWIGGDIFPAFRHGVPVIIAMAFAAGEGVRLLVAGNIGATWVRPMVLAPVGVVAAVGLLIIGSLHPENQRPLTERWEWDGQVVGRMLRRGFEGRDPLLAVDAAGTTPYFSGFDCVDMLGLNDPHLAHNKPKDFGKARIGHELGDGAYVLSRRPDLIAFGFNWAYFAYERGGREMQADPRFEQMYRWCRFVGEDPYEFGFGLWVLADSAKVGYRRENDSFYAPVYFLTAPENTAARLDKEGRFFADAVPDAPLIGLRMPLESGEWTVVTDPPEVAVALSIGIVESVEQKLLFEGHVTDASLSLAEPTLVDVTLSAEHAVTLRGIEFRRR